MSEIKYVTPSGLTHYDEKIKEVINKVDTSTNTKVTQTPTSSNETYPLLLSPTGQTSEVNTTSYFNSDVVLNPSTKTISANIDGNAETATKAVQDGDGNTITTTYVKETPEFTESTERNNIESKESMSTILGKVKKYFTDLKSHAFNALANNLTTTTEGYALDATQGKALQDKIGSTDISAIGDGTATGAISSLNSNLGKKANYITLLDKGELVDSCTIPSLSTGVYIVTITNLYSNAYNCWIGVMRIHSSDIIVLNKISGNGAMDSATVDFDGLTISISGGDGIKMQKIMAVQIADI